MIRHVRAAFAVLLATMATSAAARPGELDTSFADFGVYTPPPVCCAISTLHTVLAQADGKLLLGGDSSYDGVFYATIARLDTAGQLDPTFGNGGVVRFLGGAFARVVSMAFTPDGKIAATGDHTDSAGRGHPFFARITASGQPDETFGPGGARRFFSPGGSIGGHPRQVVVQPDGALVIAGGGSFPGGASDMFAMRVTAAGQLDSSFGTQGVARSGVADRDEAFGLALVGDGRILVVGNRYPSGSINHAMAMRLNADGSFDSSFGDGGIRLAVAPSQSFAYRVAMQAGGKAIIAGQYGNENATFRILESGELDNTYDGDGIRALGWAFAGIGLAMLSDGRHWVATGGNGDVALRRLLADGANDPAFSSPALPIGASGFGYPGALAALPNGGAALGGPTGFTVIAVDATGARLAGFGAGGRAVHQLGFHPPFGEYRALAVRPDGSVVTAGAAITRLTANGVPDTTFDGNGVAEVRAELIAAHGPTGLVYTSPVCSIRLCTVALRRLLGDGTSDAAFANPSFSFGNPPPPSVLEVYADGRIMFGRTDSQPMIQRYLPDGQLDGTFNSGVAVRGQIARVLPDNSVALAMRFPGEIDRRQVNGFPVSAFGSSGTVVLVRNGAPTRIDALEGLPDGRLLVAGVSDPDTGGARVPFVARLTSSGQLDASFGQAGFVYPPYLHPNSFFAAIRLDTQGRILVGGTESDRVFHRAFIVRMNADGALDGSFGEGGIAHLDGGPGADTLRALELSPDGRIIVAGMRSGLLAVMRVQVEPTAVELTNRTLHAGGVGQAYVEQLVASGGTGPYTFSVVGGELPAGLRMENQSIVGVPAATGVYEVAIRATAMAGGSDSALLTLIVYDTGTLVEAYYRTILGRIPDIDGRNFWVREVERLGAQGVAPQEILLTMAHLFLHGPEYTSRGLAALDFVSDLYRTFLQREPDGAGRAFWTSQIAAGLPRAAVSADFMLQAPEFAAFLGNVFGANTTRPEKSMVMDFYRGLLQRLPDSSGLDFWAARFRAAQCAGYVVTEADAISSQFMNSSEYAQIDASRPGAERNQLFVVDMYKAFMRRGADAAGLDYWVQQLQSGARTREQVRQFFVASPEFQGRVQQVQAASCMP